jgi:O-methyltransferase
VQTESVESVESAESAAELYLDLLKRVLTRTLFDEEVRPVRPQGRANRLLFGLLELLARRKHMEIVRRVPINQSVREVGRDWPPDAETMIGLRRLDNLHALIRTVVKENVPGDLLEAGVWRGGASIFARAVLKAYGVTDRRVWVADSFQGLPKPSLAEDEGDTHWTYSKLAVPVRQVQRNFARYGLLDDRVSFLEGWFRDTLATAPIERLAILRLDGDMYESTMDGLALYDKVSPGGFVIVDDYGNVEACRRATDDFRLAYGIEEPLVEVDWACSYWRRS